MRGFTLIELMVTLVVFGMVIGVGVPKLLKFIDYHKSASSINSFIRVLRLGRLYSLENRRSYTVCALKNDLCSRSWQGEYTVFEDINHNAVLDDDETVVWNASDLSEYGEWTKKRDSQAYVRFDESGHAFSSATTFLYCPDSQLQEHARQVIINFQGRIRIQSYLTSRGTPYASARPLHCP